MPSMIRIVVGTLEWRSDGTSYYVDDIILHEDYNGTDFKNDIALIRTQTSIEFNEEVQPIKYTKREIPPGMSLKITGFGRLNVMLEWFLVLLLQL